MRNLLTNILFGIILIFGVQSCTKSSNTDNSNPTSTENYSWRYKVDDNSVSWTGTSAQTSNGIGGAAKNFSGGGVNNIPFFILLRKYVENSKDTTDFQIYVPQASVGNYSLRADQNKMASFVTGSGSNKKVYITTESDVVELNITSLTSTQCSGTFSGTLNDPTTGSKTKITEGKFTVPIQ
jgi:hypothetical protein